MSIVNGVKGVSNCYVFKSQLQEYAQKAGLRTPVYETIKEGPSHEPCFRSTVIVDNVRYDSLPGFFNRKAAEQSAAEVALMEIAKAGNADESISSPVHESGLCKNLLQEYAQKMSYAIPSYVCHKKEESPGKLPFFVCTVEVGGIQYIGAAARTKKEAEIKAARTALLATIHSNTYSNSEVKTIDGNGHLTVLPCKKKAPHSETNTEQPKEETPKPLKVRKGNLKKKWLKRKSSLKKSDLAQIDSTEQAGGNSENGPGHQVEKSEMQGANGYAGELIGAEHNQTAEHAYLTMENNNFSNGQTASLNCNQSEQDTSDMGVLSGVQIKDLETLIAEVNKVSGEMEGIEGVPVAGGESLTKSLLSSNENEDGTMAAEVGTLQRIGGEVDVSQGM